MSETKIKTKKKVNKMAIAVVTLSLALIAAIGGIFGVYAALQQNVSTSFSVSYSIGKNVAVAIGANWCKNDQNRAVTWFTSSGGGSSYKEHLTALEAPAGNYNLNMQGADMIMNTATDGFWVSFYLENISESTIKVTFIDGALTNPESQGITPSYFVAEVSDINTFACMASSAETFSLTKEANQKTFTIPAGEIYSVQLMLYVDYEYINKSANYISNANGGIAFVIEQA